MSKYSAQEKRALRFLKICSVIFLILLPGIVVALLTNFWEKIAYPESRLLLDILFGFIADIVFWLCFLCIFSIPCWIFTGKTLFTHISCILDREF